MLQEEEKKEKVSDPLVNKRFKIMEAHDSDARKRLGTDHETHELRYEEKQAWHLEMA